MTLNTKRRISLRASDFSLILRGRQASLSAVLIFFLSLPPLYAGNFYPSGPAKKSVTIMLYLNGDNNLAPEVLYALDMVETVGSSDDINILALVDGRPGFHHGYGKSWDGAKLLYITRDARIGEINSIVLQDLGEQNLGAPETLEYFITECLRYTAERYIFCTFAHGRGIIDTQSFTAAGKHKSLAISSDETDGAHMTLPEFRLAIQRALKGKKLDAMVFFSCLTGMVEIGYGLKDLTEYLIVSEDEIRIVNDPPGRFQIRGIKFEEPLKAIHADPALPLYNFGKITIDTFIEQYRRDVSLKDIHGRMYAGRYPAAMALIQCSALDQLASYLNDFATYVIKKLQVSGPAVLLGDIQRSLSKTQRFSSFLNLEYYDLQDFLQNLAVSTRDEDLRQLCFRIDSFIKDKVIVYEKHTGDCASNGLSIFLSNYLIPENIFQTHQQLYRISKFSQETFWDEMINEVRVRSLASPKTQSGQVCHR